MLGGMFMFSAILFVFGIRYVGLDDAVAVSFVAPFFLTI